MPTETNFDMLRIEGVLDVVKPGRRTSPAVFASPHSGNIYTPAFLSQSRLDHLTVRRSEDCYVDELFRTAPTFGAPLLRAHFPRAYVDVNREAYELDPSMFSDALPTWVNTTSPRVAAGLGTIAKVVAGGEEIYHSPLTFDEAKTRIETYHEPYHRTLSGLVDATVDAFGCCLVVDCHSMPSIAVPGTQTQIQADIVLGDCHGSSCARDVTRLAETTLREAGLRVARNKPYAGGYTTRHYANPQAGIHTIQIEINRALYMNESTMERTEGFNTLARQIHSLIERLSAISINTLRPALAAE